MSWRDERVRNDDEPLLVDSDETGRVLGLEILAFDGATVSRMNEDLVSIGHAALPEQELAPLRAA